MSSTGTSRLGSGDVRSMVGADLVASAGFFSAGSGASRAGLAAGGWVEVKA